MSDERPGLSPLPLPPPEPRPGRGLLIALAAGLTYALGVYGWTRLNAPDSGMLLVGFLLGAPIAACIIAVRLTDPKGVKRGGSHASVSALTVTVMLVCAGVVLREGREPVVSVAWGRGFGGNPARGSAAGRNVAHDVIPERSLRP